MCVDAKERRALLVSPREMGRLKGFSRRLVDLSLVGGAVGCGYVGYHRNAKEDAVAKQKRLSDQQERLRQQRALALRSRVEKNFLELAKQYDLKIDDLLHKREQLIKMRDETQALSMKVLERNSEVTLEVKKLQSLIKTREELKKLASYLRQQKRTLDAEMEELKKLTKIKEDLQARSVQTCSEAAREEYELQVLSSKVQERNKVLEAEIEELMRLVKVKEELQAKAEALDAPILTRLNQDPVLKKDDSVQS